MPTVIYLFGWRFFFYVNEGNEPIHIHCKNAEKEAKFWLDTENFGVEEAYSINFSPRDKRLVKKIIFNHFEYIEERWLELQRRK
ncbi:MAG TPA: DUF4160 domain-containing protein [Candidatus Ozemobacteraceae bacterium]|nr:DUF4160 domain-containing protein [Candidatus Ozemobacteraceae bacterium]